MKQILYIDMDNVLVDFESGLEKIDEETLKKYEGCYDEIPGVFALMKPMEGAVEVAHQLAEKYDVYVPSTSPWLNPSAWSDKLKWIQCYFGKDPNSIFYKRLILSSHKNLNMGAILIDDRLKNGTDKFQGSHIHFGTEKFPDWKSVLQELM
ncbi:5' nucleotidase, NT5C type [Capnocytophaga canis]|uniref:5' nucleotidase, NT5C type n=1 Tax=Capnocytophaga canis TaxID=1848903 RepID=UPI003858D418